ncbi:MAG: hypothetical protein IKX53_04775 [Bacteroidales bacterium]|nr:hypothetical protein [Bacteroidales bacterium]MBR5018932.1 hypothetical protein [Bacteroidales bacterium]
MCASFLSKIQWVKKALANSANMDDRIHRAVVFQQRRETLTARMLSSTESGVTSQAYGPEPLIVTLTTHGRRIHSVYLAIESLFGQSCKPNRVVLYLSKDEFCDADLPVSLQRQRARGLEVRYVQDVGPHTKLVPALQEFPDALLLVTDDDIIYPFDLVERLLRLHRDHPCDVCATITRTLQCEGRKFKQFESMPFNYLDEAVSSKKFLAEGFGGVLYPPHCLHPDVVREDLFRKLAPTADDLWFKAMELRQGTSVCQMPGVRKQWNWTMARVETVQYEGLWIENLIGGKNDEQLQALFDYYDLYRALEEDLS